MTTTSNIVLLIIFVIGVILTAIGSSMTISDLIDDVPNHSITPHLIPLIIGIVMIGVSSCLGYLELKSDRACSVYRGYTYHRLVFRGLNLLYLQVFQLVCQSIGLQCLRFHHRQSQDNHF